MQAHLSEEKPLRDLDIDSEEEKLLSVLASCRVNLF
jgi:hypothetical protein